MSGRFSISAYAAEALSLVLCPFVGMYVFGGVGMWKERELNEGFLILQKVFQKKMFTFLAQRRTFRGEAIHRKHTDPSPSAQNIEQPIEDGQATPMNTARGDYD